MGLTVSERKFGEYLSRQGIEAQYEVQVDGIGKRVDFSFKFAGLIIRFEVKEWKPKGSPRRRFH